MAYHESTTSSPDSIAVVALTTRAGTHTFTGRDRLWVQGPSTRESRPATEVRPGDLVAFLGRVLSARLMTEEGPKDAQAAAQDERSADLGSVAA